MWHILWPQPSPASINHRLLIPLVSLAHDSIFICLFVFPFCVHLRGPPASCQAVCFSLASAQSWLLSFWSPSIPDVGKTSVLSSCLVLADSQTAAAVPCSCMGFHCMHRARPCQDQKTTEARHIPHSFFFFFLLLCMKFREGRCVA